MSGAETSGDPDRLNPDRLTPDDVDLDLVAADLAGALEPDRAAALHSLIRTDPRAARLHAEHARDLDALTGLLAAEPAAAVPDDVLRRVTAALERESAVRTRQGAALVRATGSLRSAGRRQKIRGWAAGIGGVVALAGVVALVVQIGGHGSSSSSAASSATTQAQAAPRAPATTGSDVSAAAAVSGAPLASPATPATAPTVTAADLAPVALALYADAGHAAAAGGLGPQGTKTGATPDSTPVPWARSSHPTSSGIRTAFVGGRPSRLDSPTCRPAGVAQTVGLLAERTVSFDGRPAVLLVLDPGAGHPGTVRAAVVRTCGTPALLDRSVRLKG